MTWSALAAKFRFAAKLVRGAYMVQERKRARDKGYVDPIHDTIEDTHANYDAQVSKLLRNNNLASFMVASHNEKSVVNTVQQMQDIGISRATGGVYFGQLLGMCDHVSYTLGANAYKVFKYVPYGPIHGAAVPHPSRPGELGPHERSSAGDAYAAHGDQAPHVRMSDAAVRSKNL